MSLKDSLQRKLETQAEYWSKQIDSLHADAEKRIAKARDDQAEAEIQKEFSERIQALEKQIETARTWLGEVRNSGEDYLENLKKRIDEWLPSNIN
jgi:DNA-binding transcriptional regulator GbsR (MarR family)